MSIELTPTDEDGMAYLTLSKEDSTKQLEGKVIYDLNEYGQVIGVEFLFMPAPFLPRFINDPYWQVKLRKQLIEGENK